MKREIGSERLLTEAEAAQLLRCSSAKVKRLRLNHKLGYYPGRRILISQADLEAYVASVKIIRVRMLGTSKGYAAAPAHTQPRAFKLLTRTEAARLLRCSPATIRKWCNSGKLPFLPGQSTIDEADINDFILRNARVPDRPREPEPGVAGLSKDVIEEIRSKARAALLKRRIGRYAR
jgi:excisionase family DNA binding protein